MTVKRNFKRRVRDQQRQTGERYTAARRRLLAERAEVGADEIPAEAASKTVPDETAGHEAKRPAPATPVAAVPPEAAQGAAPVEAAAGIGPPEPAPVEAAADATPAEAAVRAALTGPALDILMVQTAPGKPASGTVPVIELLDVSADASRLGLRCGAMMFPALAERVEPVNVLTRLRDVLAGTIGDPTTALLCSVALDGQPPPPRRVERDPESLRQFLRRARAGLGGTTEDGTMLVFHVAGRDGIVPVLCTLSPRGPSLVLTVVTGEESQLWEHFAAARVSPVRVVNLQEPALFLIHDGRRHPVTSDALVIGSGRGISGIAIGDAALAPRHAAVIRRNGAYYLKDLGSIDGVHYKGMRIDNKRIDDGDVFQIGGHEIRFTYRTGG
jgi:FHA domain-containing protein